MSLAVATQHPAPLFQPTQWFTRRADRIERHIRLRNGDVAQSSETAQHQSQASDSGSLFYDNWLRRSTRLESAEPPVWVADLFSGCGGLSVGASEAARAVGRSARHVLAVDNNERALGVFGDNFPDAELHGGGIEELINGDLGARRTPSERRLAARLEGLDLAIGGPPCQGNSDLNNHTRRTDPRNALYLRMIRFVEVVRPRLVLIENVPGVAHDRRGAVRAGRLALENAGYAVDEGLLMATDLGAAQSRRRHVLLASRDESVVPDVASVSEDFGQRPRTALSAIGDLGVEAGLGTFGTPATHHRVNVERIDYLFDHDLYELPDAMRPDCHRLKVHRYMSVYGRMYPDKPAPTITSGFGSTGQGRFVHPLERRTLTPHEAARIQGFPDWFSFRGADGRRALQEMIGNAVPSRLAYAAIASLLR